MFWLLIVFCVSGLSSFSQSSIDDRIRELMSKMTIQEKIGQLSSDRTDSLPHLGIKYYHWRNECLHGVSDPNAIVFPQAIALAASWDKELMYRVSSAISDEARILYKCGKVGLNFWSPNINIFRDPRWGRGQETYGEDPYLTSQFAIQYITGLQGDDSKYLKTIASPKHFLAHSGPEHHRHSFNSIVNQKDLRETYMPAFKAAIVQAKAAAIMSSYNAINGIPATANTYFLTDVLRQEWKFDGHVVSDCGAVGFIFWGHNFGASEKESVSRAIAAGCDLECGESYRYSMLEAYNIGLISGQSIDTALSRLLKAKYRLGIFDDLSECKYNSIPDSLLGSVTHKQLAQVAAQKSIVLLKNENQILPLSKINSKIFLTGPNSDVFTQLFGNYSYWKDNGSGLLQAIKDKIRNDSLVLFYPTCDVESITALMTDSIVSTMDGEPGFYAEYFNNCTLSGEPTLTRIDKAIDFKWGQGSPASGIKSDSFSVRWTGKIRVNETNNYSFRLKTDDGSRLYVDDKLVIDKWYPEFAIGEKSGEMTLIAGRDYKIRVEYFDYCYNACALCEFGGEYTNNSEMEKKAIELANQSDVIVFAGGISALYENEDTGMESKHFWHGDRKSIDLPNVQTRMLKLLKTTGKPIVLVLVNGSCFAINWAKDSVDAIVEAWYPGEKGAEGLSDVLFGDYNPAGRLPITFYKSINDLPEYTDYSMKNRTYRYFSGEVLYPFGYGLSYTKYDYSTLSINKNTFENSANDSIEVQFHVKNTGQFAGDEVSQIYLSKFGSQNYNAIKQLIGFSRFNLAINADTVLMFKFSPKDFYYFDTLNQKYSTEPGIYTLQIGSNSADIRLQTEFKIGDESSVRDDRTAKNMLRIYPNPADDKVTIHLENGTISNIVPQIFSLFGEEVIIDYSKDSNSNTILINTLNMANGVYLLKLNNNYTQVITIFR